MWGFPVPAEASDTSDLFSDQVNATSNCEEVYDPQKEALTNRKGAGR